MSSREWRRDREGNQSAPRKQDEPSRESDRFTPGKQTLAEPLDGAAPTPVGEVPGKRSLAEPLTPIELAQRSIHALGGTALPFASEIQAAFGKHDISNVRAHTGDAARRAAATLGARAFAYGNDVAFADTPDLHTAAHEAAHVIQQRQGVALKGGIDTPGDEYEQHADEVADAVVRGRSAEHLLDRLAGAGRSAAPATPVVQRDTSTGTKPKRASDPGALPPPPVGSYLVEVTSDGTYRFWFNTTEVNKWSSPVFTAMRFYMRRLFPGVRDGVIREAMLANKATFTDHNDPPGKFPANVRFELHVQAGLHAAVTAWMRTHHPELPAHEIQVGTGTTRGAGGAGATAASKKSGGSRDGHASVEPAANEDVERARALYARLYALFPESDVWQSGGAIYPALLAYLAEHPELLAKLPHGKHGAQVASVEQLRALLAGFEQRREEDGSSDGSRTGHHDGRAGGAEHGTRDGIKDNAESGPGGSRYGETGGSKYGWVQWEPKGHIVVRPQLQRYVAGSSVRVEVAWDMSVHPEAGLIVLPHHCKYSWTSTQGKRAVDSDGNSIFADDRYTSLELGKQKGQTTIEVVARSRHFKDKKRFRSKVVLDVVPEDELQKQVFDQAHVGADKTFQRDAAGQLQLNADQKALTVEDEIRSVDVMRGGVHELAEQGTITETARETLEEESTKQRAALVEIQDKVQGGTPYIVRGTFLSREDSTSFELKLLMHVQRQHAEGRNAYFELVLHDLTMGEPTQHPGAAHHTLIGERPETVYRMLEDEALDAMAEHFHAHNDYPKGKIHLAAQRVAGQGVWERTRDTNNLRKKAKKVLGTVAMVGGVALFIVPGGGALATGIMVVSGAAGAASVALEIEDRMAKEGRLKFDRRLVLDVLQLASTALAFGALSNVLREMTIVGKSRYMLAMVSVDAAQGFVMAADTRDALRKIDADTELKLAGAHTDEERRQIRADRDRQVAEVIGGAIVNGGFLLVSVGGGMKQLVATTRAGKQFTVREPIKTLADGSFTDLEAAIANQRFTHENRAVILTEAEAEFLEATLMQRRAVEAGKAPSERTTQKMPAQDPEAGKPPSVGGGGGDGHSGGGGEGGEGSPTPKRLSDAQREVIRKATSDPVGHIDPSGLAAHEHHLFQSREQQDAGRWGDHGIDEAAHDAEAAIRDHLPVPDNAREALRLKNDPEFRRWYGAWKTMPDRIVLGDGGSFELRMPEGVPPHVEADLRRVIPKTNLILTARAIAARERIVRALPGANLDPHAAGWPATRKKLVEMFGEDRVASYERNRTEMEGASARSRVDKRIHSVVDTGSAKMLRSMLPGLEIYVTGSASQASKNGPVSDLDIVVVVPEHTPQKVRAEMERRLWALDLQRPRPPTAQTAMPPLSVDAKVMTPSEFAGLAVLETPAGRTPLNYARIDKPSATEMPGIGRSGVDLHNHIMGVGSASYFTERVGGGSAVATLEKAWDAVHDPKLRKNKEQAPVSPTVLRQLGVAIADVRNSRQVHMPVDIVEARAQRALDDVLAASHETPFDHTYDLRELLVDKYIDPQGTSENYATDMLGALHEQGTTASEQSVSVGKLQKRFTAEAMANAHRRAVAQGRDVDLSFLVMMPTSQTLSARGAKPKAATEALRRQLLRPDVKGLDIAGPEATTFTPRGMRWLVDQIKLAREVAHTKGEPMVIRPHVGEGYDPTGSGRHVAVARKNLDMILGALKAAGYAGPGDGVIVRFGHAAHATGEQLKRMRALGIIVEANVGSNLATGSVLRAEDHPLLANMYYGVSTVLSTDGQGVMQTTLPIEYQRATAMITQFRSGQLTLQLDGQRVRFADLSAEQQARFSPEWLAQQAIDYRTTAAKPVPKEH